jgi:hypothetical protein
MRLKISPILALAFVFLPHSNFAASISVPPGAGGTGIQSALNALPAGGEVVLSAGKYLVQQPIMLNSDRQTLRGAGASTVLYLADGANCPVVILGSLSKHADHPTKGLRLADLLIDGNRLNQQKEYWRFLPEGAGVYNNGVDIWGADSATVERIVCCHCRSGGMVASARTRRLTVRDYTAFDNQFDGLACYLTEESHFSHLNLHDNLAAGISLDLNFNNNVIQDTVLAGDDVGIFMRQSCNNVFEGVTIQQSRQHGVFMAESGVQTKAGWRVCPGTECTGNTFSKLLISHCHGKAFLVNDAGCTNNTISAGQFLDNAQGGLVQAAADLVRMLMPDEPARSALASKATTVVHELTDDAAAMMAHKTILGAVTK